MGLQGLISNPVLVWLGDLLLSLGVEYRDGIRASMVQSVIEASLAERIELSQSSARKWRGQRRCWK